MRVTARSTLCALAVLLVSSSSFGIYGVSIEGTWPESWPEELESMRRQACTWSHNSCRIHHIPFDDREVFERAWPHILKLRSKGTPLELVASPHEFVSNTIKAGVRITTPRTGELLALDSNDVYPDWAVWVHPPGTKPHFSSVQLLKVGPPWPDYLRSKADTLPEYVWAVDGKWQAYDREDRKKTGWLSTVNKTQTTIQLIVDGSIVDLNRIPLPANAPIIDKRFEQK